jgi:sucrose-6-phosphate hydrolase SacC (GH32 family)
MTWGHAVSKDLVHWEELGDALHPDGLGTIFSGSAVVDEQNTAGFQQGDEKTLVAAYTYAGDTNRWSEGQKFTQAIAFSNDRGRTWTKYEGNPVLGHIVGGNRDPKLIWHEPSKHWVMVLYLDEHRMGIFTSTDLKSWERQSELESFYECPELFQLPVDDNSDTRKWILYGASGEYFTGEFDGRTYTPDGDALPFNYGNCFYASQTFSDIPPEDGRRIQIAWGRTGHPDMPFNQMMNFPVELTLRTTESGPRLFAWPVHEIASLHQKEHVFPVMELADTSRTLENIAGGLYDITAVFEMGSAEESGIMVCGLPITFYAKAGELRCGDKTAPLKPDSGAIHLRLLVDRLSVEIFANEGRVYMPMSHIQEETDTGLEVFAKGGTATFSSLTVHELASAWKTGE